MLYGWNGDSRDPNDGDGDVDGDMLQASGSLESWSNALV